MCDNKAMQRRTVLGLFVLILALVIAVLHYIANEYFLYFHWWWADIVMHFLGGLFIGSAALWWIRYEVPIGLRKYVPRFVSVFIIVLLVGIGWEVLEKIFDAHASINYVLDTTLDLVTNMAGMMAAYLIFTKYGE